jgi:hypothetical protein
VLANSLVVVVLEGEAVEVPPVVEEVPVEEEVEEAEDEVVDEVESVHPQKSSLLLTDMLESLLPEARKICYAPKTMFPVKVFMAKNAFLSM